MPNAHTTGGVGIIPVDWQFCRHKYHTQLTGQEMLPEFEASFDRRPGLALVCRRRYASYSVPSFGLSLS